MSNKKTNKMKKVLLFVAVAGLFAACTPKTPAETQTETANEEMEMAPATETPSETPAI